MRINLNRFLTSKLFIAFLYRFARAYARTFQFKVENEQVWMEYLENGGAVLICAWHQQFFAAIRRCPAYKSHKPSVMVSQSKDGEIAAGVAKLAGWYPVRGSSSRGGQEALNQMITNLKKNGLAGHIVDGPRGPAGQVKPGAIRLAHAADAVIVPLYVLAEKKWHFNSWDKFMLPKPFSKVTLRFGRMIKFDKVKNEKDFDKQRKQLEEIMLPALII